MVPLSPVVLLGALADVETDCACPTPPRPAGPAAALGGLYRLAPELHHDPLDGEWALYCNTLAGGAPAVLNRPAEERLARYHRPRPLSPDDAALAGAGLLVPADWRPAPPVDEPDTLTAWLHITNACNLDCPYCYVRKSSARMSLESGMRAVDALLGSARRHGMRALKLKYAGGEAALHFRMLRRLHAYAVEQAANQGLALRAVVLSNGTTITPELAEWLAASAVRLMISVDGVGAEHDAQRPRRGGGAGAFAAIERGLDEQLLPRGVRPDICITVTGRSAGAAHHAVRWAIERNLPFSLNFYRETDQTARHRDLRLEEQAIIAGMRAAYAVVEELLPARPLLDGLLDRVQASAHSHTCGVGRSYVVITHTGEAAQCQMELDEARPFAAESDLIALTAVGPIQPVPVDHKDGCRECGWRYRCAGGCPLMTLRATGRTDVQSPDCAIYKALMPEALRLEGLRVLRHRPA